MQGNISKNLMLAQCIKVKMSESESSQENSSILVSSIIEDIIADVELMQS